MESLNEGSISREMERTGESVRMSERVSEREPKRMARERKIEGVAIFV